jgi:phosphoribosylamine---glycine ligase
MRFNFISESGDGFGFAYRCLQEGNDARLWIRSEDGKAIGDNLVPKVGDVEDLLTDASKDNDVFIFDVTGNGILADYLRKTGYLVFGGSVLADRLERDRGFGLSVMRDCRIAVPRTESFNDFDKAIDFVAKDESQRWVYKPSKLLGDLSSSHISYDSEDMRELLSGIQSEIDIGSPEFELQAFVEGIAISTEVWYDSGALIDPLTNHTIERKEFMNENLGASGGCTGNITWFCDGCPVCAVVKRLSPWMERQRYTGMLDLNCIVADDAVYGLEFTPRFGFDAGPTLLWELVNGDISKFLYDCAVGGFRDLDLEQAKLAAGLKVSIPPWPSEKYHADADIPIRGLHDKWERHTYLYNVKANEVGLCTAGAWGIALLFTGHAGTVRGAFAGPYEWADNLRLKNKQYRTDLVKQFQEDLDGVYERMGRNTAA